MRAPWLFLAFTVACGPSFEADGAGAASGASTSTTGGGSTSPATSSSASVSTTASQSSASSSSTGVIDPCLAGDYSACVALDAPELYFAFDDGPSTQIASTIPDDTGVYLERAGVGSVALDDLIGPALGMTTAGYEVVGEGVAEMYASLFAGDSPHTVEMWIAEPRVEVGFSQTLFLQFGAQPFGDPADYTASSSFMTVNNGVPHLTAQRRIFDQADQQLLITASQTLEGELGEPAHIFITYAGQGELTLCRNVVCTTANGPVGSGLDFGQWFIGYTRDTQSFSGTLDELAFYAGILEDGAMKRHCEAGFVAMGRRPHCTP